MKIKFLFGGILFSLALTACPSKTSPNQNAKPTANASVAPDIAGNAKIKTGDGKGVITKINSELGSVELNHEEIKDMMPAMQMEFYVADKRMLDGLKVGDKVDFTLEDNTGAEKIISIKKNDPN